MDIGTIKENLISNITKVRQWVKSCKEKAKKESVVLVFVYDDCV